MSNIKSCEYSKAYIKFNIQSQGHRVKSGHEMRRKLASSAVAIRRW